VVGSFGDERKQIGAVGVQGTGSEAAVFFCSPPPLVAVVVVVVVVGSGGDSFLLGTSSSSSSQSTSATPNNDPVEERCDVIEPSLDDGKSVLETWSHSVAPRSLLNKSELMSIQEPRATALGFGSSEAMRRQSGVVKCWLRSVVVN
jgi:hypothetical protein